MSNAISQPSHQQGMVVVVSAPSGAGKTTVVTALLEDTDSLCRAITHTTRAPRPGEQNGVDYHFISLDEFAKLDAQDAFLEQAEIYGNRYGTSLKEVESLQAAGKDVVLVIDWQGARSIRTKLDALEHIRLFTVFLLPPSLEVLEQRLSGRGSETSEQLQRRLGMAKDEMSHAGEFDACLVNDDLQAAVLQLGDWIAQAKAGHPPEAPCPGFAGSG